MSVESFDDFNSSEYMNTTEEMAPFQFRESPKDPKATLEWLNEYFDKLDQNSVSRMHTYRRYQALYKGIHWRYNDTRDAYRDSNKPFKKPRMVVNFVHDMVETKVAQLAKFKVNVALIPNNDQQTDINNAKACKKLLDSRADQIDLEGMRQISDRIKFIFGHVFTFVEWDKDEGPIVPALEELRKKKAKGVDTKQDIRIGDVKVEVLGPDRIFIEMGKQKWSDIDFIFKTEWVHIEELKARYPKKAKEIRENSRERFDFTSLELNQPQDMVLVRTMYHKKTKFLPEGVELIHTDDVILEWNQLPYAHGEIPCIPDTDIDIYGEFWGRSFITLIEQMQRMYNNVQSAIARDHGIGSAPKWMVPKGAAKFHDLNNDFTIVEYTGPVPPQLVANKPTSNYVFELQDRLEKKITGLSSVFDISRGEVPSGVTANSALRFLDEQEGQRTIVSERKRKKNVVEVYKLMINVMGQYYKPADGRTLRILGPNNEYQIENLAEVAFNDIYDVKIQNSPALPDTKTGLISAIIDLNIATQTDPIFKTPEIIEMLDLGLAEGFKQQATIARTSAKTSLDKILKGEEAAEPQPFDDLLVHYDIFMRALQEFSFKVRVDPAIQQRVKDQVMMIEALMYRRMQKNSKFAMEVQQLSHYPIFFEVPLEAMVPLVQGAAGGSGLDASPIKDTGEQNLEQSLEQQ